MFAKIKALIASFEKTPLGTKVWRFVRIAGTGIAASLVGAATAGTALTLPIIISLVVAAGESAFRLVFPGVNIP